MNNSVSGVVVGVNGNVISATADGVVSLYELAYIHVGHRRLKAEIVRIHDQELELQLYEQSEGLRVGDAISFSNELLSVELGPGLLNSIFDGLQNPLIKLAEEVGFFLESGYYPDPLDKKKKWHFCPSVKKEDVVRAGSTVGTVTESIFTHHIMAPFNLMGEWRVTHIVSEGDYDASELLATLTNARNEERVVSLYQRWPVKKPLCIIEERLLPHKPLVTGVRIIDSLIPVALGGTYCIPGPFGAGKTVLQQVTSRNAAVDIVVIAACGERAGEVVETLREFPELIDPRTGKSLMERTIIVVNTSSMPVAARESSVYTAITMAEYYRQMGLNVLLLADSTSRWAQAMRELSGRLEEIPGEEAFPAYLESVIASFYERAGLVRLSGNRIGSVTIGGTVSPAGGNFEEPVTQATIKVVGAFHGLSRERSEARKYPAIHPLESWSKYSGLLSETQRTRIHSLLSNGDEIGQMMKVIGEEGVAIAEYVTYLRADFFDAVYLQQNAFDNIDSNATPERQQFTFAIIEEILDRENVFTNKEEARKYYYHLRQQFLDLNVLEWQSDALQKKVAEIRKSIVYNPDAKANTEDGTTHAPVHTDESNDTTANTNSRADAGADTTSADTTSADADTTSADTTSADADTTSADTTSVDTTSADTTSVDTTSADADTTNTLSSGDSI